MSVHVPSHDLEGIKVGVRTWERDRDAVDDLWLCTPSRQRRITEECHNVHRLNLAIFVHQLQLCAECGQKQADVTREVWVSLGDHDVPSPAAHIADLRMRHKLQMSDDSRQLWCSSCCFVNLLDHGTQGAGGSQRQRRCAVLNGFHLTDVLDVDEDGRMVVRVGWVVLDDPGACIANNKSVWKCSSIRQCWKDIGQSGAVQPQLTIPA
mmetsp:Transcript_34828/g.81256  ORF Transcript_34828/g.81256 Transcript_34828/m.81256 type:complete len:208 (+) Transcript_34828:1292-1915(+)